MLTPAQLVQYRAMPPGAQHAYQLEVLEVQRLHSEKQAEAPPELAKLAAMLKQQLSPTQREEAMHTQFANSKQVNLQTGPVELASALVRVD